MSTIAINFRLEMLSNFHIGTGLGDAGLIDRVTIRNTSKEVIIPGSTLKGRIRHHCEQLALSLGLNTCSSTATNGQICRTENCCLICRLFGSEWQEGGLRFSDARLNGQLRGVVRGQRLDPNDATPIDFQTQPRTRTRINRRVRRVEEGALFTLEEGAAGLFFEGQITGSVQPVGGSEAPVPLELLALLTGMRMLTHLGGKKTGGLGNCSLTVTSLEPIPSDYIEVAELELMQVSHPFPPTLMLEKAISYLLKENLMELEYYDEYRNE